MCGRASLVVCFFAPSPELALVASLRLELFFLSLSKHTHAHIHVQADKEALIAQKPSTKVAGSGEKKGEASETPLNPSYSCDAAVVRITKEVSFVFGPCPIHPYVAVSV